MKQRLALAAFVAIVAGALWATRPAGTFNIDEVHYLLAAQRWAEHHSFAVPNGFDRFRSDLLLFFHPQPLGALPAQAELTTFIPPLYTFAAAPFYAWFGLDGLMLLEALAFTAAMALAALLVGRLCGREWPWAPLAGAALFLFAGYFADYGAAVVNHMLALALVLAAVALHPVWAETPSAGDPAADRAAARPAPARALLCGLLIGLATGVRLQCIVTAAVLGAFLFVARRGVVLRSAAYLAGLAVPLGAMASINAARFGVRNPFSYGVREQADLVPLLGGLSRRPELFAMLAAAAIGGALLVHRLLLRVWEAAPPERRARRVGWALTAVGGLLLAAALVPPIFLRVAERLLGATFLPGEDPYWRGAGLYAWTGPRAALLQSMPIALTMLVAPLPAIFARGDDAPPARLGPAAMLLLICWANIAFVCLLANNGGFFMNQRYMIDGAAAGLIVLPWALRAFWARLDRRLLLGSLGLAAAWGGALLLGPERQGAAGFVLHRAAPIVLGLALFLVLFTIVVVKDQLVRASRFSVALASLLLLPALLIPFFNHLYFDAEPGREYRASRDVVYRGLLAAIPDGSLLVVRGGQREPAGRLKAVRDVWVADALRTDWGDVPELVDAALRNGWRDRAFVTLTDMPPELGAALAQRYQARPFKLLGKWPMVELRLKSAAARSPEIETEPEASR